MYHTHMRGTPTFVTSVVSVSDRVSAYERIARRDDNDSSSSSVSSTKNSKSTKCTGSKQECEVPTNSSHSTNVTVGVAVAVPVFVIIVVLAVVLYVVYKRSKREAEEDNDPDFEGDSEYLPAMHHYPSELNHPYSSDSQDYVEKAFQQPPSDPFANSMDGSKYNVRSATPPGNAGRWYVDPFQLPQETSDSNSLRDFAMRVQSDGFGGYKVAANSRNASSLSLHPDNFSNHTVIRASSRFQESESSESYTSPIDNNHVSNGYATVDAYRQPTLPVKEISLATISKETGISNKSDESPSNDAFEFEFANESGKPQRRSVQVSLNDNYELQNIKDPEHADGGSPNKGENDDYYVSRLSANEEEDIQRMRSIYQVYLDRNKTMKEEQEKQQQQNLNGLPRAETHMDSANQHPLPSIQIGSEDPTDVPEADQYQEQYAVQNALAVNDRNPNELGLGTAQSQDQYPTHDSLAVNGTEAAATNRIASSIYSVAIQPPNYQQQQQSPIYGDSSQNSTSEYNKDFQQQPQQGYPVQAVQNQQWYGAPVPQQQQYNHPQTLETIGELPTPAYLAQSASSHSLTSFKGPNKQQLLQLQTARLNGTALNPVDHPEMFYSPTNDAYYAPQQQGQFIKTNENGAVPSPYQLRQSVVMTNPSDLTAKPSYKPAGSFRSVSATNSRNNSLTTQNNAYQYLQQQQQQHYNSRVSGLLEENDVVQPPSVGGILPHSGSQDDLRRQLGSSHNYAIN
ncbi:hypothetical protein SUVZ_15G3050 [Saccharomyces uvarum]|uniref:Suppressor of lethality of kex2 gas1 double null mutant n=1 Tax=Saccharomyces uvarum TaxID=230603 RepID=A0ABN8WP04_SACUV|nr:hypothetical protein SUVZ_15G3050 [Saccharomyces uvarum]